MSENTFVTTFSLTLNDEGIQRLAEILAEGSAKSFKKVITPGRAVISIRYGEENKLDFLREAIPELTPWEGK